MSAKKECMWEYDYGQYVKLAGVQNKREDCACLVPQSCTVNHLCIVAK